MKRFCVIIFIISAMLSSCKSSNGSPKSVSSYSKSQNSTVAAVSANLSASVSISDIVNSSAWKNFGNEQADIGINSGFDSQLNSAKNKNATFKQINSFLTQSAVYTKSVPKDNITHPFVESAGYLGPPVLTISDKLHRVSINPAWYIDTPDAGHFALHQVTNILEVNFDGKKLYIQSPSFYDWLYNGKWQSSFRSSTAYIY